jgi:ketosteroid isomerase-like protein
VSSAIDDAFLIQRLIADYADAVNRSDSAAVAATFAEGGALAGFTKMLGQPDTDVTGPDAIRTLFDGVLPGMEFVFQNTQSGPLTITGDTARGETMLTEFARWRGHGLSIFLGRYADDFVRTPNGWRFARRQLLPRAVFQLEGQFTIS